MFSKLSSLNFFLGKGKTTDLQQKNERFPGNFRLVTTRCASFSKGLFDLFDWPKELPRPIEMFVLLSLEIKISAILGFNMAKSEVFLLFIVLCFTPVRKAFIIESCVGTAVFGSLAYVAPKVWCRFKECCTDRWISVRVVFVHLIFIPN